jgi:hypothetical protein
MYSLFSGAPAAGIPEVGDALRLMADTFQRFIILQGDAIVDQLRRQRAISPDTGEAGGCRQGHLLLQGPAPLRGIGGLETPTYV